MKKPSLKERLRYRFDNRMAKGSGAMIRMLAVATLIVAVAIALIITFSGEGEDDFLYNFWDSFATVINAWMPASEDGGALYIILTALAAIMGLFVTSVLIGIVSSAIEDKINDLRKGNSKVLENGHIVVLGSVAGEYELIKQLILSFGKRKGVIVIGGEFERDEFEDVLFENVDVPRNVKVICRSVDAASPVSLECLSISTAKTLIVNFTENDKTVRAVLAACKLLENYKDSNVTIVASVSNEAYMFPETLLQEKNVIMLKTDSIIAGIIARSLCQEKISGILMEIFNYEGSEFYLKKDSAFVGKKFGEVLLEITNAIVLGTECDGELTINPDFDYIIQEKDRLVCFAKENETLKSSPVNENVRNIKGYQYRHEAENSRITIIGFNEKIDNICREMSEEITSVKVVVNTKEEADSVRELLENSMGENINILAEEIDDIEVLEKICEETDHIVLLTDQQAETEDADLETMMLLMRLRDIKKRKNLNFQITAEIQRESNRLLMLGDDNTEFVVAFNMSALAMSQVAVEPILYGVFREILSAFGNEILVKKASDFGIKDVSLTTVELRKILMDCGYIFMGYINGNEDCSSEINPDVDAQIKVKENTKFIVMGEN